jgi:DNA-binding transcriptional MerR regulator
MNKSPEAFRTISEVADALDVPPHVLRFWETRFAQVKPVKRGGGRRYYRPEDVRLLRGIRGLLYDDGMTIKGVQKILRERGVRHVIGLGTEPEAGAAEPEGAECEVVAAESPARVVANGPAKPQADLFEPAEAVAAISAPLAAASAPDETSTDEEAPKPLDKSALRSLLAELQALRAVMIGEARR